MIAETRKVTCLLADELANMLWVGHSDGKVTGHSLGDAPGTSINTQQVHCWQVMGMPCQCNSQMYSDVAPGSKHKHTKS